MADRVVTNESFGAEVRRQLDSRSLSLRMGRRRTGIDIETLSRMRAGEVPRIDKVIAFARGFGMDVNDWLELAGYERIELAPVSLMNRLVDVAAAPEEQFREALGESNSIIRGAFSEKAADSLLTAAERGELTYEPEMEDVRVEAFTGRVSESDREELERVVRYLRDRQRRRSMGEPE